MRYSSMAAAVLTVALAAGLSACGDEEAQSGAQPTGGGLDGELDVAACTDLIPLSALEALGWSADAAPEVDDRTCSIETSGGTVRAQVRPVPAATQDELPDAAVTQFEERCATLDDIVDDQPGEEVDWLGPDRRTCVAQPEDGSNGTTSALALVTDTRLMEWRVEPDAEVSPEQVRSAVVELADAAAGA